MFVQKSHSDEPIHVLMLSLFPPPGGATTDYQVSVSLPQGSGGYRSSLPSPVCDSGMNTTINLSRKALYIWLNMRSMGHVQHIVQRHPLYEVFSPMTSGQSNDVTKSNLKLHIQFEHVCFITFCKTGRLNVSTTWTTSAHVQVRSPQNRSKKSWTVQKRIHSPHQRLEVKGRTHRTCEPVYCGP